MSNITEILTKWGHKSSDLQMIWQVPRSRLGNLVDAETIAVGN
ncbi:hypothetical protein [Argonema antarcticum]|nr:hypothetical protein [Argonema antarcticum]